MLNAAARRLPAGTTMEMADVASLPMYNVGRVVRWQGVHLCSAPMTMPAAVPAAVPGQPAHTQGGQLTCACPP